MRELNCHAAVEQLLAHVEHPEGRRGELDSAIRHMQECPDCERRIGHLFRALNSDEEDGLTCGECEDLLPDYIQAEREGVADPARWQRVAYHLETCPHCAALYTELSDLITFGYGERGVEPPTYRDPDLSFLRREESRPSQPLEIPWRWDDLGRLIIEFSTELVRAFQPPAYQPAYARTGLKSDRSSRVLCRIALKETVDDLEVIITAEETEENPAQCIVTVEVDIPSLGGWPNLADAEVTIKRDEKKLATQLTDASNRAVFKGVATDDLARLVFEIKPHAWSDKAPAENPDL
jgi:hypothetical protein